MPLLGTDAETLWGREERTRFVSRLTGAGLLMLDLIPLFLLCALVAWYLTLLATALTALWKGAFLTLSIWVTLAVAAVLFLGYVSLYLVVVLRHRGDIPVRVMHHVGATRAQVGELGQVKDALRDMVLASGLPAHPALWIIESPGVNALATSLGARHTHIALTRGMVNHLSKAEIRAVLAHLIARVASGDIDRETIGAAASGVGVGNSLFDTWPFPDDERPRSLYPRGYSKSSLRRGDVGAMFLLKDPETLISSLEAIERHDNLIGDWAERIGYLFVSWPYLDREIDAQGRDYDQRRIQELRTLYGVWPDPLCRTEANSDRRGEEPFPHGVEQRLQPVSGDAGST